ncbi:hypothetical protein PK98_07920 [Croceibacterium mercuriale]|uniref:Uncharacterized protein n=1 Tax=Croceibacterium mercuriale TaxID=1572751 RepID=A0A0B2C2I9_9SPHN|nr:hypothetical protein PK98_07920 [Croceibacterium mercuriale]
MRTRLSICRRKLSFADEAEAQAAITRSGLVLRTYRCDRCHRIHLTSRTKGKRMPRTGAGTGGNHETNGNCGTDAPIRG